MRWSASTRTLLMLTVASAVAYASVFALHPAAYTALAWIAVGFNADDGRLRR